MKLKVINASDKQEVEIEKSLFKTKEELRELIRNEFKIDSGAEVRVVDLKGEDVDEEYDGVCVAVTGAMGTNGEALFDMGVDITPDVDLLIQSGDDYDMVTAIAELLDNSIQNTTGQQERDVNVTFARPSRILPPNKIVVFDNGRGMTLDALKNWAVLGKSNKDREQYSNVSTTPATRPSRLLRKEGTGLSSWAFSCDTRVSDYLTSDFSRYGVGSKKAVFSLGDTVTVTTRVKGSPWVSECSLSRDSIKQNGWKTTLKARAPTQQEAAKSSFTCFIITDLKQTYKETYTTDYMVSWLAHLYHYYIHGPRGNTMQSEDADDELKTSRGASFTPVNITVDGVNVKGCTIDSETLQLHKGTEKVTFDFILGSDRTKLYENTPTSLMRAAPKRTDGLTQGEAEGQPSQPNLTAEPLAPIIKVVLQYFPFKDGVETMPIPAGFCSEVDDEKLPLCDRKPGMEVFWNGRLLPREFIEVWPLLRNTLKKDDDIPAACFRRVKGMIFLDSSFEVTANKHCLCRETPLAKAMLQYNNRTTNQSIRKWIRYCHKQHDEELIFGDIDKAKMRGDGTLYYKSVKVTNLYIEHGTYVLSKQPTGRGKVIGKVVSIFTNHKLYETAHGCQLTLRVSYSSASSSGDLTVPVGLLQKVLTNEEAEAEIKKAKRSYPVKLVVEGLTKTMPATDEPEGNMKVTMCTEENKVLNKPGTLEVTVAALPNTGGKVMEPVFVQHVFKPLGKKNYFSCSLEDLKEYAPDLFTFAGKYTFQFKSSVATIAPLEVVMNVVADAKKIQSISSSSVIAATVDKELSVIDLHVKDRFGNPLPYDLFEKKKPRMQVTTTVKTLTVNTDNITLKSISGGIRVSGLKLTGLLGAESCSPTSLLFNFSSKECAVDIAGISPGKASDVKVLICPKQVGWKEAFKVVLCLQDSYGNPTTGASQDIVCELKLGGNAKLSKVQSADLSSENTFVFDDVAVTRPPKQPMPTEDLEITLQANIFYIVKGKHKATSLSTPMQLLIKPPRSFPHILLEGPGIVHTSPLDTTVQAEVGTDTSAVAVFHNPPTWVKSAIVKCSWAEGAVHRFKVTKEQMSLELPVITAPTKESRVCHEIIIHKKDDETEKIEHKLSITYSQGAPTSIKIVQIPDKVQPDQNFSIQCKAVDRFENELPCKHPDLKNCTLKLVIVDGKCDLLAEGDTKARENTWSLAKLKVTGKSGVTKFKIVAESASIESPEFTLDVVPGEPCAITIDGKQRTKEDPLCFNVENMGLLKPVRVGLVDKWDNECVLGKRKIVMECPGDVKLLRTTKQAVMWDGRLGVFTPSFLAICKPGQGTTSSNAILNLDDLPDDIIKGFINVNCTLGQLPWDVRLTLKDSTHLCDVKDKECQPVKAGTPLGEAACIEVLCENGTPCNSIPTDRVALHVISQALHSPATFPGPPEPSQARSGGQAPPVKVTFSELEKFTPTGSGVYTVFAELDLMYHKYKDHLEKIKCLRRRVEVFHFTVIHTKPTMMKCKVFKEIQVKKKKRSVSNSRGSPWADSHHLGGVASNKAVFESLEVRLLDEHDNLCTSCDGPVTLTIQQYADGRGATPAKLAPVIEDPPSVVFANGEANIPELKLGPNKRGAPEGSYCLHIAHKGVQPIMLPFQFTDDAIKEKQLAELGEKIREWVAYQHYLEKKLKKFSMFRAERDEIEAKWDSRMKEVQDEMLRTKKLKSPNWATFDPQELAKQTRSALGKMEAEAASEEKSGSKRRKKYFFQDKHKGLQMIADAKNAAGSGVVGVVAEIGWCRDERIDATISKTLGRYMQTVVLENSKAVVKWKKQLANLPSNQQLALLSLDNFSKVSLDEDGKVASLPTPNPKPKGWVGYAVNLVELEDKNIFLRPVFYNLLGNKAVFDSIENARSWRQSLLSRGSKVPHITCLDGEKMEQNGIEWAGQQHADAGFRFGAMPACTTDKYKSVQRLHNLLETYAELQVERKEEKAKRASVDPKGEEPQLRAKLAEVCTMIKGMNKLMDTPIEKVTTSGIETFMNEAIPQTSQAPQVSGKKRRAPSPSFADSESEPSDTIQDADDPVLIQPRDPLPSQTVPVSRHKKKKRN